MSRSEEKKTIADRFASIRTDAGLSRKAFAESLSIHPVVAGDIELGKREPSREVLVKLVQTYGVDASWLLTGRSAVAPSASAGEGMVAIACIDQEAAAGRGAEIADYPESKTITVPRSFIGSRSPSHVRSVPVRGDSMIEAGLDDGDVVFFSVDERSGDGIHVVSVGNQLLVKRVEFDHTSRTVRLISENPRYGPRVLEGADLELFSIEGRVIGVLHRM
ncbi:MAG: helix-turn-helix domain-containing protein [Spirochaetales bacterium]|nr:helix-turn-helix domain-containing protein [Spirochaetales bacterium]